MEDDYLTQFLSQYELSEYYNKLKGAGYDKKSSIKRLTRTVLMSLGIQKQGHLVVFEEAIQSLNGIYLASDTSDDKDSERPKEEFSNDKIFEMFVKRGVIFCGKAHWENQDGVFRHYHLSGDARGTYNQTEKRIRIQFKCAFLKSHSCKAKKYVDYNENENAFLLYTITYKNDHKCTPLKEEDVKATKKELKVVLNTYIECKGSLPLLQQKLE